MTASYQPHTQQKRMHESRARFINVVAGRRAGKSKSVGRKFIQRMVEDLSKPEVRAAAENGLLQYWAAAPTDSLTKIQVREIRAALNEYRIPHKYVKTDGEIFIPGWPVVIRCRSTFAINQLVGEDVWGLWWDETAKAKPEAWGYLEPCLTSTAGWVLTSTTPEGMNWYYDEFWLKGMPDSEKYDSRYANFHFTSAENPFLAWICPTCKTSYRAGTVGWKARVCPVDDTALQHEAAWKEQFLPPRIYKREYKAAFDAFQGQIWDALYFGEHWKLLPANLRFKRLIGGQDWNFALPGVFLLLGEDARGNWWVLDEIHQERLVVWDGQNDSWVKRIKAMIDFWEQKLQARCEVIWADPANPQDIQTERQGGLSMIRPAENPVSQGIQSVSIVTHILPGKEPRLRWLAEPSGNGVGMKPRADLTWKQCLSYRYQPGSETPLKENDHGCDALRYAIHSTLGRELKRVGMQTGRLV